MGYTLEAIIASAESVSRYMESHDSDRFVSLSQGFAMIPLDEQICKIIDQAFDASHTSRLIASPSWCHDSTARFLHKLSDQSIAALLEIDCAGGMCHQRGVVYQDLQLVYNRDALIKDPPRGEEWKAKTGISLLWARLCSKPLGVHVPNAHHVASVAHEALELIGVQCDDEHFDAFDQLGLGRFRQTEEWLGDEG